MSPLPDIERRPFPFENGHFYWNMQRVPDTLPDGMTPHPSRSCAIFVVHGIGQQLWTETSANLRAGFEEALQDIADWQEEQRKKEPPQQADGDHQVALPPPFIREGYWANYDDVRATFPADWARFNEREQKFFCNLWKQRVLSGSRTVRWVLGEQVKLLRPKVLREVGLFAWLLYWPLQIVSTVTLLLAWFRYPKTITDVVNDARLYLEPRGVVERAIVQEIDDRVGKDFLQLIGLDWNFRPLAPDQLIEAGGKHLAFSRVVWVSHSLGTVISYNVLSALFYKAEELERTGDDKQKAGVTQFRSALTRFVTMGSPLDKVAFLFNKQSLRPWPASQHRTLLPAGEVLNSKEPPDTEWWINFYHVLDPVSGALQSPFICGEQPPSNIHIRSGLIPGLAHLAYWADPTTLRFILGRTYGRAFLKDKEFRPWPAWVLSAVAAIGYFTWATILCGVVFALVRWGPDLLRALGKAALKWVTG